MTDCNIGKTASIGVDWAAVEALMEKRGLRSFAALAALTSTPESMISRSRASGRASIGIIRCIKTAFPDADLDELLVLPAAAAA